MLWHLFSGPIQIDGETFFSAITNFDSQQLSHNVVWELRIPRMITALIAGAGLSIAGLLMQTLFNNPLAGPYVLGINSGASLFVAFAIMAGIPMLSSDLGIIANALIGAFLFGLIIVFFSSVVRQQISLLLIGLMLGSFTSAIVSVLQSASGLQELKLFTLWALGSLQAVTLEQLPILFASFGVTVLGAFLVVKPLNLLVLGTSEAALLGVRIKRVRLLIILVTAVITGVVTAFCGPIAFVGLAVPNLIRIVMKTQNHSYLILGSLLTGAIFLLICDITIQYLESLFALPINALTSLIGAPFVILLVLRRLR
ncbi:MAG: iron ABC transporter permease [bacterium]|nr:iron ABC transporter permease [bacterium]